jgi:L-fucose mutarotase
MGLLKGLDPLLTADLLFALRSAGHGDIVCICDCNFPAAAVAKDTVLGKVIQLPGADLPAAMKAILSVLPVDYFIEQPLRYMAPAEGDFPDVAVPLKAEAEAVVNEFNPDLNLGLVRRHEFYTEARKAFVVVQTFERRPYGNILISKGVVGPDGKDLKP